MQEIKNNPQEYTTQEGIEEIKSNPQVNKTQERIEEIKNKTQVYATQESIEEIKNNPQVYKRARQVEFTLIFIRRPLFVWTLSFHWKLRHPPLSYIIIIIY